MEPAPSDSPTPSTIVDSVINWEDINREEAVYIASKPKIGGLFVDKAITDKEKWVLIPFVITEPDDTTNV